MQYEPRADEPYMSKEQLSHFRSILLRWRQELMEEVDRTVHHMRDEAANFPDPADRATQEEEFSIELRTRDRERKLIKKIDQTIERLDAGLDHVVVGEVRERTPIEGTKLSAWRGNYSAFELQRAERIAAQQGAFEKQQTRIAEIERFVARFKAKATKATGASKIAMSAGLAKNSRTTFKSLSTCIEPPTWRFKKP